MRIAICDDEIILKNIVKEMCENIVKVYGIKYEIVLFDNGYDLLHYDKKIEILLLDIGMPNIDGLTAARALRMKGGDDICIIFLTSYAEMIQKAFKVKAFRYLIKPVIANELMEAMGEAIKEIIYEKSIVINLKNGKVIVPKKEIIYIESLGDYTSIYMKDNNYYISNEPLKYWLKILDQQSFFQIHKSYIICLAYIKRIQGNLAVMVNNRELPISIRNNKAFKEKINEYIKINAL